MNKTLCLAVWSRVIRSNKCVLDSVCFHKFTEFFWSELWAIMTHELLWNAIPRRFAIVASIVMLGIISTSNHFEWLSTTIRNILPINGPAKSMCTLYHGIFGQSHGCKGAGWGLLRDFWQLSHFLTIVAISLSRLGHQTWSRASDFIRTIPGCPVCNSYSTRSRGWLRIITRISYGKQPSSTVISWRLLKKKSDPAIFYLGFLPSL